MGRHRQIRHGIRPVRHRRQPSRRLLRRSRSRERPSHVEAAHARSPPPPWLETPPHHHRRQLGRRRRGPHRLYPEWTDLQIHLDETAPSTSTAPSLTSTSMSLYAGHSSAPPPCPRCASSFREPPKRSSHLMVARLRGRRATATAAIATSTLPPDELRCGDPLRLRSSTALPNTTACPPPTSAPTALFFGVYHTADDNYDWFARFADPTFAYTQQQARIFRPGPPSTKKRRRHPPLRPRGIRRRNWLTPTTPATTANLNLKLDFNSAFTSANLFATAARTVHQRQVTSPADTASLNCASSQSNPAAHPRRPASPPHRHSIYAPGEFTGYEAIVIPGVNEAIDAADALAPRPNSQPAHALQPPPSLPGRPINHIHRH